MSAAPDLAHAVMQALRAPSVHNTQPWRWRITTDSVELHADWHRHLVATDPDRRDLYISCGAALHHLVVALAAAGQATTTTHLPDPDNHAHLATVTITPGSPDPRTAALAPAIARRRTDRRRMSHLPVSGHHIQALTAAAHDARALLVPVTGTDMHDRLLCALADAAHRQTFTPGYPAELRIWTGRYTNARDGVPSTNIPPARAEAPPLRHFPGGVLGQPRPDRLHPSAGDASELLVVATPADTVLDQLHAGEATSAVLLTATRLGLATTPLSQGTEITAIRDTIRNVVLHIPEQPQLILRVGWPDQHAPELPETPRRDIHAVLLPG